MGMESSQFLMKNRKSAFGVFVVPDDFGFWLCLVPMGYDMGYGLPAVSV
jgi:hypothetical protein